MQRITQVLPSVNDELYSGDRRSLVPEDALNDLYAEYAEHNRKLASRASGFWARSFFPERSALPPVYPRASAEELALIDEHVKRAISQER